VESQQTRQRQQQMMVAAAVHEDKAKEQHTAAEFKPNLTSSICTSHAWTGLQVQ
jgi:hypothetical protein